MAKTKRIDRQLLDRVRGRGRKKTPAQRVVEVIRSPRSAPSAVRDAAAGIQDRLQGGPAKRQAAARKAARTRRANARKRSEAAKRGARTRAKAKA